MDDILESLFLQGIDYEVLQQGDTSMLIEVNGKRILIQEQ